MNLTKFRKKVIVLSLFALSLIAKADEPFDPQAEIFVGNLTSDTLYFKFYPDGPLFNGGYYIPEGTRYSLKTFRNSGISRRGSTVNIEHVTGLDGFALSNPNNVGYFRVNTFDGEEDNWNNWLLLNHDASSYVSGLMDGLYGYGKYVLEIYTSTDYGYSFNQIVQIPIDWLDFNYPYAINGIAGNDLILRIYSVSPLEITLEWDVNEVVAIELPLFGTGSPPYNGGIQVYKQYHRKDDGGNWIGYNLDGSHPPSLGDSKSDNLFLTYPLSGKNLQSPYTLPEHLNPGYFDANIVLDHNASTQNSPISISIRDTSAFIVGVSDTFTLATPTSSTSNFSVQTGSSLFLSSFSEFKVMPSTVLTFEYNSKMSFGPNAKITVESGGALCNIGAQPRGPVDIVYKKGTHNTICKSDFSKGDSVKFYVKDSATLVIPDSSIIQLRGKESRLVLSPYSKIKFGVASKIVLDSGARIIANNATFTSTDTTKLWDGIYSSDLSLDTISNCKIINAKNGINLVDKSDETWSPHSFIITDCDFINKTSSYINNAVYAYNSDEILFRNNKVFAESTGGFYCGVNFEFCPGNELLILDNEIEDCYIGISDIQSSAYIARNVLEGSSGYGYGITRDNASGTLKYNVVNNFDVSIVAYLSSPYMYKNTLNDASSVNLSLESYSIPMMNPAVSGEITYWYGGNNTLSLSETSVGISMYADSYPLINNGYNKFYLNDADYYIEGEIATELPDSLEAKNNYWSPSVNAGNFNTTGGTVKYNPTEDGSAGSRSYNTIQTLEIGFGFYDTIYVNNEGDNLNTDLFIAARTAENSGNFQDAIEYYKDLVSTNEGDLSRIAIQRIYCCYEKARFFGNGITAAKNYFNNLRSNTTYDSISRALANDMYIKAKFRNSELSSVENDYDQMYQSNQNNGVGVHALINKTIVEDLISDSTDNLSSGSQFVNLEEHKQSVINILSRNNRTPFSSSNIFESKKYTLEQNYPNPFNPETKIRYTVPVSGMVSLKIYDVLGREVATLVDEFKSGGSHEVIFDGSNLTSGVYFYKMTSDGFTEIKRMMLLK